MKSLFPVRSVRRVVIALSLLCSVSALPAADKLPLDMFTRFPAISHPTISRDGRTLAYGAGVDTPTGYDYALLFKDLDGGKNYAVDKAGPAAWVAEDRVVYGHMAGIDRDGRNYRGLLGWHRETDLKDQQRIDCRGILFDRFTGEKEGNIIMNEYDSIQDYSSRYGFGYLYYPNVTEIDTRTGAFIKLLKNPGKVTGWLCDGAGRIRVGVEREGKMNRIIYRNSDTDQWHVAAGLDYASRAVDPIYLNADGTLLYLSLVTPEGNWGVYTYDLAKQKMGDLILSHGRYDILPYDSSVSVDGFALERVVISKKTREVLGIQYVTDMPKVIWFDPTFAQVQAALDQNLAGKINTIVDFSDNLQRLVVLSWAANDIGTYYVFDLAKRQLTPLFKRSPWIKPEQMAEMKPISYKSRDGLTIHGYLTLPRGADPKQKLPLVVYPHGGPFVRDSYDFDYDVQFLANRGYAVLQMNYRGSPGFGESFLKKGMKHIGRGIQDDIEDGARWAIAQGIADPGRIAIMGWSFGGYSAAIQPMRAPDLYRCAIDLAGVTDWKGQLKYWYEVDKKGREVNADYLGDFEADAAELDDISPINHVDKLRVPMLLAYGKNDNTVHFEQFTRFKDALDKAHKPIEVLTRNEPHGFYETKNRAALYTAIEAFLAKNMGPK